MPALPSSIIEPIWGQFAALLHGQAVVHPLGCHRPRIPDRTVFDKLVQVPVFGCAYHRIADAACSATTLRRRRDEWMPLGSMERLRAIALDGYDRMIGLELDRLAVDGCITKAPCGGEVAGRSPVDRGNTQGVSGPKRSVVVDANGIPLGAVAAPANRHDAPLLGPTLDTLDALGPLPAAPTVHLDAGTTRRGPGNGWPTGASAARLPRRGFRPPSPPRHGGRSSAPPPGPTPTRNRFGAPSAGRRSSGSGSPSPRWSSSSAAWCARAGPAIAGTDDRHGGPNLAPFGANSY